MTEHKGVTDASAHDCPADGCTRRVPSDKLACRDHWFKVSLETRNWVTRAYKHGSFSEHHEAMNKAIAEMNA